MAGVSEPRLTAARISRNVNARSRGLSLRSAAIIAAYGATLLLIGLGNLVLTYHEVNYSEPAREMLNSHQWVITRFLGSPFVEKPPLINWCIAASITLFHSNSEWVVRLPSVIFSLLSALIIAGLSAKWFGERIGLLAGLMQLTTIYVQAQGRRAEPDILLCFLVSVAMAVFAAANVDRESGRIDNRWMAWLFYFAAALSFYPKGPIGPVLIFLPCAVFSLLPDNRRALHFLLSPAGIAILLTVVMVWPIAAYRADPGAFASLWHEHSARLSGEWGSQPLPFYLYTTLFLMLPWTPFVLLAFWRFWKDRAYKNPAWQFLGLWFGVGAAFMSLCPFKHWHYLVPVLPPLSVAGAFGLDRIMHTRTRHYIPAIALLMLTGLIGLLAVHALAKPQAVPAISLLIVCAIAGALGAIYFHSRAIRGTADAAAKITAVIFATVWIVSVAAHVFVAPYFQTYLDRTRLALRINREVAQGAPIYLIGPRHNQMVYYISRPIVPVEDPARLEQLFRKASGESIFMVGPEPARSMLTRFGAVQTLDDCGPYAGSGPAHERVFLMKLSLKPLSAR